MFTTLVGTLVFHLFELHLCFGFLIRETRSRALRGQLWTSRMYLCTVGLTEISHFQQFLSSLVLYAPHSWRLHHHSPLSSSALILRVESTTPSLVFVRASCRKKGGAEKIKKIEPNGWISTPKARLICDATRSLSKERHLGAGRANSPTKHSLWIVSIFIFAATLVVK